VKQNPAAPVFAGAGVLSGVAAMVVALFSIGDCVRFQTRPGECNRVVSDHAGTLAFGALSIGGAVGGFFTVNPMLERGKKREDEEALPVFAPRELPPHEPPASPVSDEDVERVQFMHARGLSDEQIGEATGLAPRSVAAILEAQDLEPGL
jgi:hypothetical protein